MELKYRKINIKYQIKITKLRIRIIKYVLKHNKKLTEEQRKDYSLQLIEEIKFLNYKRWCLLCL